MSFLTLKCNYPIQPTPIGTTVWTVDFEIPNFFAVSRTVALVCIIKFATSTALSSIYVFKPSTPSVSLGYVYARGWLDMYHSVRQDTMHKSAHNHTMFVYLRTKTKKNDRITHNLYSSNHYFLPKSCHFSKNIILYILVVYFLTIMHER